MLNVTAENGNKIIDMQSIHDRLDEIRTYLEREISFKQTIIEGQEKQVARLKLITEEKDAFIQKLESQLQECRQTNEGTRQLINKLLNDIGSYQKDIEWYKRTYVKRSLPGTIWQKIFRK